MIEGVLFGLILALLCVGLGAFGAYWLIERYQGERLALYRELGRRESQIEALQREPEIPEAEL